MKKSQWLFLAAFVCFYTYYFGFLEKGPSYKNISRAEAYEIFNNIRDNEEAAVAERHTKLLFMYSGQYFTAENQTGLFLHNYLKMFQEKFESSKSVRDISIVHQYVRGVRVEVVKLISLDAYTEKELINKVVDKVGILEATLEDMKNSSNPERYEYKVTESFTESYRSLLPLLELEPI